MKSFFLELFIIVSLDQSRVRIEFAEQKDGEKKRQKRPKEEGTEGLEIMMYPLLPTRRHS